MDRDCACYSQFLKTDGDRNTEEMKTQHIYETNEEPVVTVLPYFNFFQCEKREDERSIERFYVF